VRLLHRPELLTNVVALLPDHPPRRFSWRGGAYKVSAGEGPERIHGEWWRSAREMWAVRDYFMVETGGGERFWLFRRGDGIDAPTGDLSWYLHGVFG
jgi:protein ImuB